MTQNTIEIEVELKGQKNALKGLDQVKEGAEGIGETFKGVGDIVGKTNQQMGESLNAVSNAVGESAAAFQGMRDAIGSVASGSAGITTLLGPLALLTTAVGAAYEAYRQLSGAAREAEIQQEAMAAASADLTSKLEELAEKGIGYAKAQLLDYIRANLQAQMMKELLEKRTESSLKVLQAEARQLKEAQKAGLDYAKALQDQSLSHQERVIAETRMKEAIAAQQIATQKTRKVFSDLSDEMIKVNAEVDSAAKRFKALEETTDEGLKTKAKELIARRASLEALKAETSGLDEASRLTALHNAERSKTIALDTVEKLDRTQLKALVDAQNVALKALNETSLQDKKLALDIAKATAETTVARKVETKAIDQQKLAQRALREEQARLVKESQIRQLDIKLTKEGDDELLALARERYETGLQLAKDDAMKRAIVQKQYQLEVDTIMDQAEAKEFARMERMDAERERERQRQRDQLQKEADDLVAQQKLMVSSFEEFTKAITKTTTSELQSAAMTLGSIIDEYGPGFAKAGAEAILFGDVAGKSFKEATGELLKSLAVEATVKALMKGAEALAMAFINPALAGNLAASAAAYGAAAAAARAGAGALGVGGGGGGGGTTASPSGAPQVASAPQREQAETSSTVVNINFGGAVIYDTQEAARRAMVNDIVQTYNRNPRGMARFNQQRMR
jgi:hypothetical protein